jgi:hypothetical protein
MATTEDNRKEYLAWINLGGMGTRWRSNTIKDAVETCAVIAAQDWGGLRGRKVSVAVYDVTGVSVALIPSGVVLIEEKEQPRTEIPPLFLFEVDLPAVRKNGNAYSETYTNKVEKAAHTALEQAAWEVVEHWNSGDENNVSGKGH